MRASLLVLGLLAAASHARAEPQKQGHVSASIERHYTTDALDSPRAVADSYSRLSGSFHYVVPTENGRVGISGEATGSIHDTVSIEDDRSAGVAIEASARVAEPLELRGVISAAISDEGDDLDLETLVLGIRTQTVSLKGTAQAGYKITPDTVLAVEVSAGSDIVGKTRFKDDIVEPLKLEPDRRHLKSAVRLAHTVGDTVAAVVASLGRSHVETIGDPPVALGFTEGGVVVELAKAWSNGARASLAIGVAALAATGTEWKFSRPVWRAEASMPLSSVVELRGALAAAFETADTDDPLASFVTGGEIELVYRAAERLTLSVGAFTQAKMNLLLENREDIVGGYGEAAYPIAPAFSLVVRADYRTSTVSILDIRKRRLDAFVGLRSKL